ncbi:MAG: sterol desaturase family protein [Bdellovibrionales bacterium]|nr:sterol desaturase family protein [Bdellovibrionales bacterium]
MNEVFVMGALLMTVLYRHFVGPVLFFKFFYRNLKRWQRFKIQKKAPLIEKIKFDKKNTFKSAVVDLSIIGIVFVLYARGHMKLNFDFDLDWQNIASNVVVFGLLFFIQDLYFYLTHALFHRKKLYRHVHAIHHHSTNPTPWTSFSHHFLENFVELLVYPLVLYFLPLNFFVLIFFVLTTTTINFLGHCGFEVESLSLSRFRYFKWVASFTFHNRHHQYFNGNYGLYFTIWDRVFKTEIK